MSSLVDQIFQQADAGSANGQGFGEFFAKGVQMGHDQQRINLAQQQLAAELAMQPLKQTLMQQDAQLNSLKVENLLTQRQNFLKGQEAMTNLSKDVQMALSEASPLDALSIYTREGLKNPNLVLSPQYKEMGDQLKALTQETDRLEYQKGLIDARKESADAAMKRADILAKDKADVLPQVQVIEGEQYIVNPKTGHFEKASKTATKADFISKHILAFTKDNMLDEKTAADRLSALYDEKIAPLGKQAPTTTITPTTGKVRVKHPDGRIGNIPASQLSDALANGYKQVE